MEEARLSALIVKDGDTFQAKVEELDLLGTGATVTEAQDDLIEKFTAWLQGCEEQDNLEEALSRIGLSGVGEETELVLEFQEQSKNG